MWRMFVTKFPIKFYGKLIIIAVPFFIAGAIFLDIGFKSGEAIPPTLMIQQQQNNHQLIYYPGRTRLDLFYYKYTAIRQLQPEVLILGSSRFYTWRTDYMVDDGIAYNAAIPSARPSEMALVVESFSGGQYFPDVIILALDYAFFNEAFVNESIDVVDRVMPPFNYDLTYVFNGTREVARDYSLRPTALYYYYARYEPSNLLGNIARNTGRGFIYDGSYYFPDLNEFRPGQMSRHETEYLENEGIFRRGDTLNADSIQGVEDLLAVAQDNNAIVIGLMSPYNSEQFERMMLSGEFAYIEAAREQIQLLFDEYDMPLADYTDIRSVNGSNEELYDYWHPGEVLSLRIYYQLLQDYPGVFEAYSNRTAIEDYLSRAPDNLYLPSQ